jgi:hypothetical protein
MKTFDFTLIEFDDEGNEIGREDSAATVCDTAADLAAALGVDLTDSEFSRFAD